MCQRCCMKSGKTHPPVISSSFTNNRMRRNPSAVLLSPAVPATSSSSSGDHLSSPAVKQRLPGEAAAARTATKVPVFPGDPHCFYRRSIHSGEQPSSAWIFPPRRLLQAVKATPAVSFLVGFCAPATAVLPSRRISWTSDQPEDYFRLPSSF